MAIKLSNLFSKNKTVAAKEGFTKNEILKNPTWLRDSFNSIIDTRGSKVHYGQEMQNYSGIENPLSGIGGARDITGGDTPVAPPFFGFGYWDAVYRSNLFARKVIDIPATDITKKWRKFIGENYDLTTEREEAEKKFRVASHIRTALKYAALYGGSALLIVVDDGLDLDQELDIKRIRPGQFRKFQPVFLGQMYPTELINLDPSSPYFRRPKFYNIANNTETKVHQSRLILFDGVELPLYSSLAQLSFGDSRLTSMLDILNAAKNTYLNIANLIAKANIDVIGMKDFNFSAAANIMDRMDVTQQVLSNLKILLMDAEDKFQRNELTNLNGLADLLLSYLQMIASGADMPLTRFLGTSVGGFSTGDNEIIEYYDSIAAKQTELEPQLTIIDGILEQETFGSPKNVNYEWLTLYEPTPTNRTSIQLQNAQRDESYLNLGVLTPKIIAEQLRKDGVYDLSDEYINQLSDEIQEFDFGDIDETGDFNPKQGQEKNPVAQQRESI